jgi:hypothetical protein
MTAGEVLRMLDHDPTMPTGWARLVQSDTSSYRERYSTVRNTLEVLARQKFLVIGTTINAKGQENSTTYARPRDASADWSLQVDAVNPEHRNRALQGLKQWLAFEGSQFLDGISAILLTRKSGGTTINEIKQTAPSAPDGAPAPVAGPKRRRGRPPGKRPLQALDGD